ncbi:MAG TPA: hypothetical protein VGH20_01715 [Myxococcales bacterium]|jgi:hypothetical protein
MKRLAILLVLALAGCGGTTGSALVSFTTQVGGPTDAVAPLAFDNSQGFHVSLTRARLRLGAVYLNSSVPTSGSADTSCVLPGIYVAEDFGPLTVDLLSPFLQPLPARGEGTESPATTAEVWLTGGDVNAPSDQTVILDVAGTATKGSASFPFQGTVTISDNRKIPITSAGLPGSNPICKRRIVTPISVNLTPTDGGTLTLRIDPRGIFRSVDFAQITPTQGSPTLQIPDTAVGAGGQLFDGLRSNSGVYQFSWSR